MSLFSILIPTWNRSEYLTFALSSAISQTFKDIEVIVSDNASEDNTKQVVERFSDSRIKYFRTKHIISAGENFNNTFFNSTGEYFILMGDDDYLLPHYLEEIYKCLSKNSDAEVFLSKTAEFDYRTKMLQIYSGANNSFREVERKKIIERYFNFIPNPHNPTMACFSKQLAEKVCKNGELYYGPFPDYLGNFSMIIKAKRIFKTDQITNITTITKKSLGIKLCSSNKKARQEFIEQSPLLKSVPVPIKGFFHVNGFYQTLFLLKERFPNETGQYKINIKLYYVTIGRELTALTFQDFKAFDFGYFRKLISFLLKIPFSVLIVFITFHFPTRLLYGIFPEKVKNKMINIYLKIAKKTSRSTIYLGKNFTNLLDVKEKILDYQMNDKKNASE